MLIPGCEDDRTRCLDRVSGGTAAVLRSAALIAIGLALPIAAAYADPAAPEPDLGATDLKRLSIEELMDVQVTSVARHPEKLLEAAAAIQVITREEIRRSGAATLPEVLRLADNLEVAQKNSHDWAISARGFNTALANKLLVMIDGRTVYTPLFSGVFWDAQDYLLEDVERIEVISGPGGTLWGSNAVNGIINIITRSAAATQGAYFEAGGGEQPQGFGGARYGGTLAPGVDFRVYAKYLDMDWEVLPTDADAGDGWHQGRGGFRIDATPSGRDALSVHGDFYEGHEGQPATPATDESSGGNLVGHWAHTFSATSDFNIQAYYDRTHLAQPVAAYTLNNIPLAPAGVLRDDLTTYDVDFQHQRALGAWDQLVWGLGYRRTHDVVQNAPGLAFLPSTLDQSLFSAFLQDEVRLGNRWSVILGSKIEHNDYTGFEFEPNIRAQWTAASTQTLWSAISRAARTPSRVDRDLVEPLQPIVILAGSRDFRSEYVTAYELGYRGQLAGRLTGSVSSFYNDYSDIRSTSVTPGTLIPLFFANYLEGHTYGMELSGTVQVLDQWSVHLGYDLLEEHMRVKPGAFDLSNALNETADPEHQLSLRSSLTLRAVEWDTTVRWIDALTINNGPTAATVPSYAELDSRLAWRLSRAWELSIAGRNLLHNRHVEYGFPGPSQVEIARSVYGKLVWTP